MMRRQGAKLSKQRVLILFFLSDRMWDLLSRKLHGKLWTILSIREDLYTSTSILAEKRAESLDRHVLMVAIQKYVEICLIPLPLHPVQQMTAASIS